MTVDSIERSVRLSVIVIAYNMAREIPRTLASLSRNYQQQAVELDYEVILVDNGSTEPLDPDTWSHIDIPLRHLRFDDAHPSPAQAVNLAAVQARGDLLCLMIDGAHLLTPGVFKMAMAADLALPEAVVALRYFFLGPDEQNHSMADGYNQDTEDQMLATINWPMDGYRLFEIGTPFRAGSAGANWLHKMFESNCLFLRRSRFEALGGADEAFNLPGGGFVNLDLYKRACDSEGTTPVQSIGEGSFHQIHGGTTTNVPIGKRKNQTQLYREQYRDIRGHNDYVTEKEIFYLGHLPTEKSLIHRYHRK